MKSTLCTKQVCKIVVLAALGALLAFALVGCGAKKTEQPAAAGNANTVADANKVIRIGASPTPHAEILEQARAALADQGYSLDIIEYTDYVIPNTATEDGSIEANYFQHLPYLEDFNKENGTHLVSIAAIHFEPLGVYPGKTATIDALADGAKIAVPNDTTNEARALLLLQDLGIIKLPANADLSVTPKDIVENPKNIEFIEAEAAALPRALGDVDLAVINGNYALSAGLSAKDMLASEDANSLAAQTYANIIVVKEGNETSDWAKALTNALQSDTVRSYIEKTYGGVVVPVF